MRDKGIEKIAALIKGDPNSKCEVFDDGIVILDDGINVADLLIKNGIQCDAIITDPPWINVAEPTAAYNNSDQKLMMETKRRWSSLATLETFFTQLVQRTHKLQKATGCTLIFCGDLSSALLCKAAYPLYNFRQLLTWEKTRGRVQIPFTYKTEFIWYLANAAGHPKYNLDMGGHGTHAPVIKIKPQINEKIHFSEKPVAIYEHFLRHFTNEGDLVIDLFGGSMVLMNACRNMGRRFLITEVDKNYAIRGMIKNQFGGILSNDLFNTKKAREIVAQATEELKQLNEQ